MSASQLPVFPFTARRHILLALILGALGILWLGTFTDLDLRLADLLYDPATHLFPWRHAWLTERFGHEFLRRLMTVLALIPMVLAGADLVLRGRLLGRWRPQVGFVALCAIAIPAVTSLLKHASSSHCPWDLARYGGHEPYLRLLDHVPALVEAGKCLPAGHASSALWLVAIGVFWLPHRPGTALRVAGLALLPGVALGWLQQMRGAHFLTHTLWSVWIAVAIAFALLEGLRLWQGRAVPAVRSEPVTP
ncbi:membrane-associated PAP2 superfamily phosphatase [Pseudoduganella lurida]|uniref:Membrane-associated PAP2 superfamily phosphatase n=1 Tax=Pseudoduganella lurida TaxID=1036180 RepID=A0A562RL95_9BURK|nr:phosphatase PAP2 family protein [Pseudoduganella lurida]TWI69818.1 membrane-associated PAP2 superfamily phosphatase [Pseudoduganella lurida]